MVATIGAVVKFQCLYDLPDGNDDSVYWYLQTANKGSPVCLSSHHEIGTLTVVCGQRVVLQDLNHYARAARDIHANITLNNSCKFQASSIQKIQRTIQQDRGCSVSSWTFSTNSSIHSFKTKRLLLSTNWQTKCCGDTKIPNKHVSNNKCIPQVAPPHFYLAEP